MRNITLKENKNFKKMHPILSDIELNCLKNSLLKNGFDRTHPILTWHGYIVDGHNRYALCKKHNIPFITFNIETENISTEKDVMDFIIVKYINERRLTINQIKENKKGTRLMKELKIDPELRDLLPPLTDDEYKQLEKNIVENGFDKNFPIMEWHGFIVDGHNRFSICKKHNIEYVVGTLGYETKDEVMQWMLDIQLGRRNLSPIQRIAVAEKYRPIYERQALLNKQLAMSEARKSNENNKNEQFSQNSATTVDKIDVRAKLAKTAGVSTDTYSKGKKILDSDNEKLKKEVLSGEKSINAAYKVLQDEKKKEQSYDNQSREYNIEPPTTSSSTIQSSQKNQVSDEVKQICEDLKTEKTKEYLDSIWDYRVSIIECMNADFQMYYDGFVSILKDMENRVSKSELDECINNAENNITKLLTAIELAKNTKLKTED